MVFITNVYVYSASILCFSSDFPIGDYISGIGEKGTMQFQL